MTNQSDTFGNERPEADGVRALAQELAGNVGIQGLELAWMVRRTSHLYDVVASHSLREAEVSGARLGFLIHLYAEEKRAGGLGVSPTRLSHCRRVSKNTISSMLRGLEEQGLIERALDPEDKRVFRIRLSAAGQDLVRSISPDHFARMNELASSLSVEEREQLLALLGKLTASLKRWVETSDPVSEHS